MSSSLVRWFPFVELAVVASGCAARPASAPRPDLAREPPLVVAIASDAAAPDDLLAPADASGSRGSPGPSDRSDPSEPPIEVVVSADWSWFSTKRSAEPHAVALRKGDAARSKMNALLDTSDAGLGVTPVWFDAVGTKAEDMSRSYASAFHAADATPEERVAVALLAAESALSLAKRLEDLGLSAMPKAWRSDPRLAVTFEDVSQGPARRWRDEGLALVQLCIETAFEVDVHDASTKKCQAIRKREGKVAIRRAYARDAGARGCRCVSGDPMCSETEAWCARR